MAGALLSGRKFPPQNLNSNPMLAVGSPACGQQTTSPPMKFTPDTNDTHFNEWYKEFHLLFEDSHGDEQETMEIVLACYYGAREGAGDAAVPILPSSHQADDLMGAMAEAFVALHDGRPYSIGLDFAKELSRRCRLRFDKEMEAQK
jgi:hypothetical protein